MNLVEAGLFYLKKGIPVFPFRRDKNGGCVKWEHYHNAFPSQEDVRMWFTKRFSREFIALVTGKISNLMVVDLDSQEAYDKIQEFLPDGFVTPTAKTKRGYHIYFQYHPGLVSKAGYMQDVDVKTDGGCVIAPPSANGNGVEYKWLPGLSIEKVAPAPMPSMLLDTLLQCLGSYISPARAITDNVECPQTSTTSTNVHNMFELGRRDEDLFHTANCLAKGGMPSAEIHKVLEKLIISWGEEPDEKWIKAKVESAFNRKSKRTIKLVDEVREWILSTNGNFLSTDVHKCLHLSTRDEQKNLSMILSRMQRDGIIEKVGNRNGEWRLIDQDCKPMDWINASCEYLPLWMPLGLGEITGVQPGNVLVFAGAKDSGKTAWLLNMAKENRGNYKIHYFNSEMGPSEFKLRASKFTDITVKQWNDVSVYERSDNFPDVIKPGAGNLNIIDFLEVVDEFWRVAATIQKIHQKLNGALCIIALQKNPGVDLGRGGAFSLEKARLYVSLDYQNAKIISCKNFKQNEIIRGNPRGYTCKYKLVDGCHIQKQSPGWTSPIDKEAK